MAVEDTFYGISQNDNKVYKVSLQWDVDEAGVRRGRPNVIVEEMAEFRSKGDAQAFVRAWNQDTDPI